MGILKKIDELGRIVIPSEIRKELNIKLNQEIEIDKMDNKIIITNPDNMRSKEEIEKALHDIKNLKVVTEYQKGFIDALKMVLKREKR